MAIFESKDALTALELAGQVSDLIRSAKSGSLIEYTKPTRVEPVCLVDSRIRQLPYADDLMHTALNNFVGYYLQAVAIATNVGDVNVIKLLDKLNPSRSPSDSFITGGSSFSLENALPFSDTKPSPYSQEASNIDGSRVTLGSNASNTQTVKFNEDINLSVGKLVEVTINSNGQEASFPIQVRLHTMAMRPDVMVTSMSLNKKPMDVKETWHQWRSKQIRFFADVLLAQDMIEEHRTALKKDTTGYYKSQISKKRKNRLSGILTMNPSVATASSIFVMTTDTVRELEGKSRIRLSKFKDREQLFKDTYGMILFVVDPDHEMVTVYNRSIDQSTEVSVREIQRANKGGKGGPDIVEILNALRESKAPGF